MAMLCKVEEVWKKKSSYDEPKCERDIQSAGDLVMRF